MNSSNDTKFNKMEYTEEQIQEMAKIEANDKKHEHINLNYQDGIYYGFQQGFEKALSLFATSKQIRQEEQPAKLENKTVNNPEQLLPIVFWAHFRGTTTESYRMERWKEGGEAVTIIEWVTEQRKKLEQEKGESFVMVNCGVIR